MEFHSLNSYLQSKEVVDVCADAGTPCRVDKGGVYLLDNIHDRASTACLRELGKAEKQQQISPRRLIDCLATCGCPKDAIAIYKTIYSSESL